MFCSEIFRTSPNSNITLSVIGCIENLCQIHGAGLHKIRFRGLNFFDENSF